MNYFFECQILRRSDNGKKAIAMRSVEDFDSLSGLDWRRVWNKEQRVVKTLLDLFPSLKFAHESMLPLTARLRKRGVDPKSINWKNSLWYRRYSVDLAKENDSLFFDATQILDSPKVPTASDLFRYDYVDVVASEKNDNVSVRLDDICRLRSIWLAPVDEVAIAWACL